MHVHIFTYTYLGTNIHAYLLGIFRFSEVTLGSWRDLGGVIHLRLENKLN